MNKKLLRKKLALMLATLKKKRPYYCEVGYIESTGTQYVDTGFTPNQNTKVELGYKITQDLSTAFTLFGSRTSASANGYSYQRYASGYMGGQYGGNIVNSTINVDLNRHIVIRDKNKIYLDGTEIVSNTTSTFTCPGNLYLNAMNNNGTASVPNCGVAYYYMKIYDNGTLVRDFVPVLDWDYVPCMYDRVTEQLFYNAGTGDFVAGREIHPVEYLESTGTQYIDTGFNPTSKTRWEYDYQFNNTSSSYIGNGMFVVSPSTQRFAIGLIGAYFNMSYGADNVVPVPSDTDRHMFIIDANNMYWKIDNSTGTYSTQVTASLSRSIYFFARNGGSLYNPHSGKLYGSKIYDDGILVRDYKPAIDENGVGFIFDRVTHTIYDNAGTGAFSYPAREVEYLQSDGNRAIDAGMTIDDTCGFDIKWMALNANDTIIIGTKGAGDSRWVLSGDNNPRVNLSWNTLLGGTGLGLNKIQTAKMNYLNDRKRSLNDIPLDDITTTLSANASTYSVAIFGGYWGSSSISLRSACRIYYAKITKGSAIMRDYLPAFKNGSPCLFDKVEQLAYFGTGTGSFTTGKIVEPEYE